MFSDSAQNHAAPLSFSHLPVNLENRNFAQGQCVTCKIYPKNHGQLS